MKRPAAVALLSCALLCACDDPKPGAGGGKAAPSATASAKPTAAATATEAAKPKTMPDLLVDTEGPYLGGKRVDMSSSDAKEKMAAILRDLPINAQPVTLLAEKRAKTRHVGAVVDALGNAGAPKVVLKTDGRNDLPKEIVVVPQSKITAAPGCSVATSVLKDLSTAVWPARGGLGKKQRKGLAGPDLSHTAETFEKDLAACESSTAFFSSDDEVQWEMAFNLAGTLVNADIKKKIDTLVLLADAPVAGRALPMAK